jgi:hypothetical protein
MSFVGKFVGKYKMPRKGASCKPSNLMAGSTGLEPAASAVTGQRSNQLNYDPACAVVVPLGTCHLAYFVAR